VSVGRRGKLDPLVGSDVVPIAVLVVVPIDTGTVTCHENISKETFICFG